MSSAKTQFKPGQSGNTKGRPKGSKIAARKTGATKLKRLLRALEPLADDSIATAAEIMQNDKATEATRLKAAVMLLQNYVDINSTVYFEQLPKQEKEERGEKESKEDDKPQEQPTAKIALFSNNSDD